MKKIALPIILAVSMILSMSACGGSSTKTGANNSLAESESSSQSTDSNSQGTDSKGIGDSESREAEIGQDVEAQQELYNEYIEVNNFMVGRLNDSLERYFHYVNFQEEFEPIDKDYDCYSIMDSLFTHLEKANSQATAKGEKDALDQAFLAMYPSINQLMTTLNDIAEYTDIKSYLDDDYAKGKEYHTLLWTALNEYQVTGDAFMTELSRIAEEKNNAYLEELKNAGLDVMYCVNMVMNLAQAIETEFYTEEVTDENILDMNMEIIQPMYDEFVAEVEKLLEYSKDEEKLKAEGIPYNSVSWEFFLSSMKDTKKSLTEIMQHVKDNEPLSYSDTLITTIAGNTSIGSFQTGISEMIDNYNDFIGAY